ncbi:MAG: hypothetical protein AMXMBFR47_03050 [Planctomycetota bacterium]
MQRIVRASALTLAAGFAGAAGADVFPIALNYNFNGLVHAGEANQPDAPAGYRSISDRALNLNAGPTSFGASPIVGGNGLTYTHVATSGVFDIVHIGNRNAVDGGNWMFDVVEDGDNIGIQPTWLIDPDQSASQVTTLSTPITLDASSQVGVLYQVSNGGGSFDVRLGFSDGSSVSVSLVAPDWFQNQFPPPGGPGVTLQTQLGVYPGSQNVDRAATGSPLNVTEGVIGIQRLIDDGFGDFTGRELTSITFENRSNFNAGYAILAASVSTNTVPPPPPANDDCSAATPVGEGNFTSTSIGATGNVESGCAFNDIYDVWFVYTPSLTGQARIRTCESGFDTVLSVYDGCGGNLIDCNDDNCGQGSEVLISVTQGVPYYIRVAGYDGARGVIALTIANPPDILRGPIVNPANGHTYYLLPPTDWATAEGAGIGLGGHLAAIADEAENDWVRLNMLSWDGRARTAWIGFNDELNEGVFEWTSGDPVTYSNWNEGEPNDAVGGEDYTEMQSSGGWNDLNGTQLLYGLIEVPTTGGCPGDLDGSGAISIQDLALLLSNFGTTSGAGADDGDLDGDGDVDIQDLANLLSVFGTDCP